jgi:gas vesicle protein
MKKQMKKTTKKGMSTGSKVAIGGAVAALSAVGAGAYLLFGPDGKTNQKKVVALANKMKKEITTEYKKAKKAGAPVYNKAVDIISKNYAKQYKAHEKDINAIAKKIKSEWKDVEKTVKATTKKVAKVASKKRG